MTKTSKAKAAAPKATREERSEVMKAAHAIFKATGLPWGTCQLAAWESWRTKKFEALRAADEAIQNKKIANGEQFIIYPTFDPYRITDETKRLAADGAWFLAYEAMSRAQKKAA